MSVKEEEEEYSKNQSFSSPSNDLVNDPNFVNHINPGIDYASRDVVFKNEDEEVYEVDREIKDEPVDDSVDGKVDSLHNFNMDDFGNFERMNEDDSRIKMEEEEPHIIESLDEEGDSSARSSGFVNVFEPGKPLDPLDTKRIQSIRDGICTVTKWSPYQGEKKEALIAALFTICTGELTFTEASKKFNLKDDTLRKNVQKARLLLGSILPSKAGKQDLPKRENSVTIDGITVPKSIELINQMLTMGQLDYSKAQPFQGMKDELREKIVSILQAFNFKGEVRNLADGVMLIYMDHQKKPDTCRLYKISETTLNNYSRVIKIFIKFAAAPAKEKKVVLSKKKIRESKAAKDDRNVYCTSSDLPKEVETEDALDSLDEMGSQTIGDDDDSVFSKKGLLKEATSAVCSGNLSVNDAAKKYHLNAANLRFSVQKSLKKLGRPFLPQEKIDRRRKDVKIMAIPEEETVTFYGITVPNSIDRLNAQLAIGRLNYSKAQPILGTKDELRVKMITILQAFNIRCEIGHIVDAIVHVYVDGHTISEVCNIYKVTDQMFSNCFKAVQVFVDFAKSPCTQQYQNHPSRSRFLKRKFPREDSIENGGMEPHQLLSIPPEKMMNDCEIKKEEIKEEPIEPPL